jgi:hypothetical protein
VELQRRASPPGRYLTGTVQRRHSNKWHEPFVILSFSSTINLPRIDHLDLRRPPLTSNTASITSVAQAFFEACEKGKGWEGCSAYCTPDATFSAQSEPLLEKTLAQYTDWMKDMMTVLPDAPTR